MAGRVRRALLSKSREAALTAVQTYNNPLVGFKSETFIVLMTIAWTYLLHAFYSREGVDFRYLDKDPNTRNKFLRAEGRYKLWDLSSCIKVIECPLDKGTADNLNFLLGLRHEIEHQRPPHLDERMSGRYLACAMNFDYWLSTLFGEKYSLGDTVSVPLHFREMKPTDVQGLVRLPSRLAKYIADFEGRMTDAEYNDPRFAVRLVFTRKLANHRGQADRAIEFLSPADPAAAAVQADRWVIRDTEKAKYRAWTVVDMVQAAGYREFGKYAHTQLWRKLDAKNPAKGFGVSVANEWFWYDSWVTECKRQRHLLVDANVALLAPREDK